LTLARDLKSSQPTMKILKPRRLRRGDLIGLVAPASPPWERTRIDAGVRYLERLGYRVRLGRHIHRQHGYLAGTDAQRAEDFNQFLRDREVRAIFAVRGGYGTPRLLPAIDYAAARRDPKIIVGYSDITALQMALWRRAGLITFAGPMLAADLAGRRDPFAEEMFWRLLTSQGRGTELPQPPGTRLQCLHSGKARGRLLGTNLSLLASSLGTPFSPDFRGGILLLEDVGEQFHRLDRMLTQLRNAGVLRSLAGLVLGHFTKCSSSDPFHPHLTLKALVSETLEGFSQPAVRGLAFGHVPAKITVPLGCLARLNADEGRLELLESPVT
jgi:muramoyltetrapeptide carboxypeptidase